MTSPASNGQQRPSQLQPTMADTGGNGPLAPHMRHCAPRRHHCLMEEAPQASSYNLGGSEGVYGPQNTPMLWRCIIVGTMERFDGHTPPHSPQNYNRLLGGLPPIRTMRRCGA